MGKIKQKQNVHRHKQRDDPEADTDDDLDEDSESEAEDDQQEEDDDVQFEDDCQPPALVAQTPLSCSPQSGGVPRLIVKIGSNNSVSSSPTQHRTASSPQQAPPSNNQQPASNSGRYTALQPRVQQNQGEPSKHSHIAGDSSLPPPKLKLEISALTSGYSVVRGTEPETDSPYHSHRHKEKKKKKKKDKKKSQDKDRDREHKHRHKKKKKNKDLPESSFLESGISYKREFDSVSGDSAYHASGNNESPRKRFCSASEVVDENLSGESHQPSLSTASPTPTTASSSSSVQHLGFASPSPTGPPPPVLTAAATPPPPPISGHQQPQSQKQPHQEDTQLSQGSQAATAPSTSGTSKHPSGSGSNAGSQPPDSPPLLSPKREPESSARSSTKSSSAPSQSQPSAPANKQAILAKVLEHFLVMLEKRDSSNFFSQPVSDSFAPGYSQIIKEPMDFSTMREKIAQWSYDSLKSFRYDFNLICNNCMTYNLPDTVYYKAAKRLHHQGLRLLAADKVRAFSERLPILKELGQPELGFLLSADKPGELTHEEEKEFVKVMEEVRTAVRQPPGRFQAIPDNLPPDEIRRQVMEAAQKAAAKLTRRRPNAHMGFLRQKQDGSTTLALVTPTVDGCSEKPVTLGQLIGRIKNGASALQGFKEDRRNVAKGVHPLYYGAYSSYGPAYDSTFANLTKQETELVYSAYGDDVGVGYAESIKKFSRNCEYATCIVDHLLDILTGNEHTKTTKYIDQQKMIRSEEETVKAAFERKDSPAAPTVDFDALKSLESDGIDMSFLDGLKKDFQTTVKLENNAVDLDSLIAVQSERLSKPPPTHTNQVQGPSPAECQIAERVQANLVSLVGDVKPKDVYISSSQESSQ